VSGLQATESTDCLLYSIILFMAAVCLGLWCFSITTMSRVVVLYWRRRHACCIHSATFYSVFTQSRWSRSVSQVHKAPRLLWLISWYFMMCGVRLS